MTYSVVFCLPFILIYIKCVENKEFCDKNFNKKLVTGVMNYNQIYFLVFRENDVWSLEYDIKSDLFLKPKFKENFVGKKL
jgi:hypothetical protein